MQSRTASSLMFLIATIIPSFANAEWSHVPVEGFEGKIYVDKSSIQRSGSMSRMLSLSDFQRPSPVIRRGRDRYMSITYETEYDCQRKQYRNTLSTLHSLRMGMGQIFNNTIRLNEWTSIEGQRRWKASWEIACN